MLTTTDYFVASELTYRHDRIARDHGAARNRGAAWSGVRSSLRPPRRPTLRLPERRLGGATLA